MRAIADTGYTTPTPIQAQAIPLVLQGGDLMAAAQTGTGKTAGFTLPILQILSSNKPAARKPGRPRCLILTPTRELTAQVAESVQTYGKYASLTSMVMFGGVNINPQISALRKPVDILVATPGRLLDHAGQKTLDLSGVEILVLDEADRMLDMGFIHDIRRVLRLLPAQRQNLLFSATFSEEIRQLARGILRDPGEVSVTPRNTTTERVAQSVHLVQQSHKRDMVSHLIRESGWHQVLVFTRTKHGANRLAEKLVKDGLTAAAIHGNKSQSARTRALSGFKDGGVAVLVATDIAARGLDITQLPLVVNFELPNVPEDYVHRIGRTGRAGATGTAISLVDDSEIKLLKGIERLINKPIERKPLPAGWTAPVRSAAEERAELDDDRDDERPRGGRGIRSEPRRGQGQGQSQRTPSNTGSRGNANGGTSANRSAKPAQPNGHGRSAVQAQGDRRETGQARQPARRPEGSRPQQTGGQPRRGGALLGK
ncbi:DEAD/DEAH box helicase [Bordetella sp. FB-8]|uniref:DEAD/DEAH box helicase n=1 Tax=Bordetella sp. FB-8 TaxID=1159870 RepID=UPI0012DFA651|nr:DEAD/DEAH box helicase [Bordetella sp. FB-8]